MMWVGRWRGVENAQPDLGQQMRRPTTAFQRFFPFLSHLESFYACLAHISWGPHRQERLYLLGEFLMRIWNVTDIRIRLQRRQRGLGCSFCLFFIPDMFIFYKHEDGSKRTCSDYRRIYVKFEEKAVLDVLSQATERARKQATSFLTYQSY